jgi:hypothetical protein
VVTLQTGGVPETIPEGFDGRGRITKQIEAQTMLGRAATLEDVGNAAVFAASDMARTITAAWPALTVTGRSYASPDSGPDPTVTWHTADGGTRWRLTSG